MSVLTYSRMCGYLRRPEKGLNPPGSGVIGRCLTRVLGTESAGAISAVSHGPISLALILVLNVDHMFFINSNRVIPPTQALGFSFFLYKIVLYANRDNLVPLFSIQILFYL